jgi:hypothetical protein
MFAGRPGGFDTRDLKETKALLGGCFSNVPRLQTAGNSHEDAVFLL